MWLIGNEFVGRFAAVDVELASITFGPSIAYRVIDGFRGECHENI